VVGGGDDDSFFLIISFGILEWEFSRSDEGLICGIGGDDGTRSSSLL